MRSADGVCAHVLEQFQLVTQSRAIDSGTERAEVVVIAYASKFGDLAVEEEAFCRNILDRADAEAGVVAVNLIAVNDQASLGSVERRRLG
jgi:hypothetical protein